MKLYVEAAREPFMIFATMYHFLLFLIISILSSPAQAADKFLGLLELPALCADPCPGSDRPVRLYGAPYMPDASHVISRNLYIDHARALQDRDSPLWPDSRDLTRTIAAAVVYEAVPGLAYKIKIGPYDYWVKQADAGVFHPYPDLLIGRLAYLQDWNFWLHDTPGETQRFIVPPAGTNDGTAPVRVTAVTRAGGRHWLQVELPAGNPCDGSTGALIDKGWVPAFADEANTQPAAWFHAKGC